MRRNLIAIDERVAYDERLSDAEYRLLMKTSAKFGTKMFNADAQTFDKLQTSRRTFYRLCENLIKCQYLQHNEGNSQYSVSVSTLALVSAKNDTDSANNGTGECQTWHTEERERAEEKEKTEEEKEKRTKREKEEEKKEKEDEKEKDTIGSASPSPTTSDPDAEKKTRRTREYQEIIGYLNQKTGKRFTTKSRDTQGHISARLDEGFTVEDFKTVIDKKCREWLGTEMEKYIRPETLFSRKFDRYLNESNIIRKSESGWDYRVDTPDDPIKDEIWNAKAVGIIKHG